MNGEACVWSERKFQTRKPSRIFLRLRSQKGFSLMELMVTTAIAGVVALGISSIYIFAIENFKIMVNQNAAQESLLWTAYQTKALMQQATGVSCAGPDYISCGYNSSVVAANAFLPVAEFDREASDGGSSFSQRTRIQYQVFQRQLNIATSGVSQAFDRYGAIGGAVMFDLNVAGASAFNDYIGGLWYDRIVRFDVNGNGDTRTVNISSRYFIDYSNPVLNLCHPTNLACGPAGSNIAFRDLSMEVVVTLRNNNVMATGRGPHGNLYYYRYVAPPILLGM